MLTETLGVLVAFSTVMLLLSLLVTSLGQIIQHLFRLRGRNLHHGIRALLESVGQVDNQSSKLLAARLMNDASVAPLTRNSERDKYRGWAGSPVSWIDPGDFEKALQQPPISTQTDAAEAAQAQALDPAALTEAYRRAEKSLSKRFALHMRYVSVACGLIVALVFQVSTPALLQELSTDPELRAELIELAPVTLEYADAELQRQGSYQPVHQAALAQMSIRYPDLAPRFSQLDVDVPWWGDLSEQMADEIEERPDVDTIIGEFESLVIGLTAQRLGREADSVRSTTAHLGTINITPFRLGRSFYQNACVDGPGWCGVHWANLIGVLLTVVLLTFGAPFWFNTLKNLTSLRDLLSPRTGAGRSDSGGAGGTS